MATETADGIGIGGTLWFLIIGDIVKVKGAGVLRNHLVSATS